MSLKNTVKIEVAEIERSGKSIVIPEEMTTESAIKVLTQKLREEETTIEVNDFIEGFFLEIAAAFSTAMERLFGFSIAAPTPGFFEDMPPQRVSLETAPGVRKTIAIGIFKLPTLNGTVQINIGMRRKKPGAAILATIKKKDEGKFNELCELTRRILTDESIYIGKAVKFRIFDDATGKRLPFPEPQFLDLSGVNDRELIFSHEVENAISTSIFTPIEKTDACRKAHIPLKRGILLSGKYGTGKTLATYVTAAKCIQNGWTFLYCEKANELAEMVQIARCYQPCVIFCEDIDRVVSGERSVSMDDILNTIDGIESKKCEIMIILTTNHLENINPAMLRPGRLDAIINVLPPDAEAVERLLRLYGRGLIPENTNLKNVSERLAGQIPAVIRECVERAKLAAIKLSGGTLTLNQEALEDASDGMNNQLELLNRKSQALSDVQRIEKLVGQAFSEKLQLEEKNQAVTRSNGH